MVVIQAILPCTSANMSPVTDNLILEMPTFPQCVWLDSVSKIHVNEFIVATGPYITFNYHLILKGVMQSYLSPPYTVIKVSCFAKELV